MKFLNTLVALLITITVSSQEKLEIQGKMPDLYVDHTVGVNETLQTAGTRFGVTPAKLAAYNSLDPNAPLAKKSKLRIPLTKENFLQVKLDNALPVYHIVGKGDNLYRISVNYNKIGTALLKEWNNLSSDIVKNGQSVIVGFINVHSTKPAPSSEVIADLPVITPDKKKAVKPVEKPPVKTDTPAAKEEKPVITETKKEAGYSPKDGDEGYFAAAYTTQNKDQLKQFRSGDAAVFKTVSGWTDRKYYILINDAPVGTIVRITSAGKNICAKVLGALQETKGSNGLLLRMSNAAAAALGITDAKFAVSITYFE